MKTIRQTYIINSSIEEVWKALVNPEYIEKWGGGPAEMNDKAGTEFKLWDGDIHGKNIEIEPLKKLKQEWFGGNWSQPSTTTFTLKKKADKVRIDLLQINVPDNEVKNIDDGWKEYYLGPLKQFLENK